MQKNVIFSYSYAERKSLFPRGKHLWKIVELEKWISFKPFETNLPVEQLKFMQLNKKFNLDWSLNPKLPSLNDLFIWFPFFNISSIYSMFNMLRRHSNWKRIFLPTYICIMILLRLKRCGGKYQIIVHCATCKQIEQERKREEYLHRKKKKNLSKLWFTITWYYLIQIKTLFLSCL